MKVGIWISWLVALILTIPFVSIGWGIILFITFTVTAVACHLAILAARDNGGL